MQTNFYIIPDIFYNILSNPGHNRQLIKRDKILYIKKRGTAIYDIRDVE